MTAGRIDTHHHVIPGFYARLLAERDMAPVGRENVSWSVEGSLALMEAAGISAAVLSVSTPGAHFGDDAEARDLARRLNEETAAVVAEHPRRYGFFATLPLPDVDGALAEAVYALDTLDADGVVLLANARGTYLGDPTFDPLFDELQRRRAVVFVHPTEIPGLDPVRGVPPFVADFLLDTTRAAINLARSGTLERCPDVKVILSHAGGMIPFVAYRASAFASPTGDALEGMARLQRCYFDVALSSTPTALPSLLGFAAPSHVTYGSDWPFAPDFAVHAMRQLYEAHPLELGVRRSIDSGCASELFPRLAPEPEGDERATI